MILSIKKSALRDIFVSLFIILVFVSPLIRLALGFKPYLLVFGIISCFSLALFLRNYYKGYLTYTVVLLLSIMSVFAAFNGSGNQEAFFYSTVSLVNLLLANWLVRQDATRVTALSFIALNIFYLFFIYSGIKHGFMPADVNNYFLESSRNVVSTVALLFQVLYSASYYKDKNTLPKITPLITLLIAFFAYGRSGIALSAVLVVFTFLFIFWRSKFTYKLLAFSLISILFSFIYQYLTTIELLVLTETNFNSGLDTPRTLMVQEYIRSLNLGSIIMGTDLSTVPIINQYGNNPHNSIIYGHSQYGIFYIFLLLVMVVTVSRYKPFNKRNIVYTFLLLVFFVRILADKLSLPGVFDFIFYYLIYALYLSPKDCGINSKH